MTKAERNELKRVRDWLRLQEKYCRLPNLPPESCAGYGAVVWGLAADKLDSLLADEPPFLPGERLAP